MVPLGCFLTDPKLLIQKLSGVLGKGGVALFHEYAHYLSWRFIPRVPSQERFAAEVQASWEAAGGKADIAMDLPAYLLENGFIIREATPRIYCVGPDNFMWQWPTSFIGIGLARLKELGRIDDQFVEQVEKEFTQVSRNPNSLLITPLVLEIVAEKVV